MTRLFRGLAWCCNCTAIALLMFGLAVTPDSRLYASDEGGGEGQPPRAFCDPNVATCNPNNACKFDHQSADCTSGVDICKQQSLPHNCGGCTCRRDWSQIHVCKCQ